MFAKIYRQIFDSSLADDPGARRFFMEMLVLADRNGVVDMTAEAIAGTIKIPLEEVERCIDVLMDIDPNSRSKRREGARIRYINSNQRLWGWVIVHHDKYRDCHNKDDLQTLNRKGLRKSFVYYIYAEPRLKIGCAKNPWARLARVKKSYPRATIMAMEPGDRKLMEQRYEEFKDKAIGRDHWFMGVPRVLEHVHAVRQKYGLFGSDGPIKRVRSAPKPTDTASPRASPRALSNCYPVATTSPRDVSGVSTLGQGVSKSVFTGTKSVSTRSGSQRDSSRIASKLKYGLTSSPMKLENGDPPGSNGIATGSQLNTGLSDTDTDKKKKKLSEFIEFLIEDPRFRALDVEAEVERAVAWCRKRNKAVTEGFLKSWLLRAEPPLEEDEVEVGSLACEDYYSWAGWTEERRRALLELWPGAAEPPQRWDKLSPDIKKQIEARVKEGWG